MEQDRVEAHADAVGDEDWLRVKGRPLLRHPMYSVAMRAVGELAYHLLPFERDAGLVAYDVVLPGRLSRSGQPSSRGWELLRSRGVRTIINLRLEDDGTRRLRELGFSGYLHLPIADGLPPTERQALAFLRFLSEERHWPAHLHCLSGIQRSGIMSALAWYSFEGWPVERALRNAYRHLVGPTGPQRLWLRRWARGHRPGEWAPPNKARP